VLKGAQVGNNEDMETGMIEFPELHLVFIARRGAFGQEQRKPRAGTLGSKSYSIFRSVAETL